MARYKAKNYSNKPCPPGGEFVFKMPDGREVGKAKSVADFVRMVKIAPLTSLLYHANGGHFAPWLEMMGEKELADEIKDAKGNDESVRKKLVQAF
ncbi:MAG: hypothetical protein NT130_02900 [Candidatus Micrarchaeota archaeon]|nr:hypothetical protein [Candidatus Micrarchaeota archaeon]